MQLAIKARGTLGYMEEVINIPQDNITPEQLLIHLEPIAHHISNFFRTEQGVTNELIP